MTNCSAIFRHLCSVVDLKALCERKENTHRKVSSRLRSQVIMQSIR